MEKSTPCVNSGTKNCTDFVTKRGEISCDKCIAEKQSLFVAKRDETVKGYITTISALEQENKALKEMMLNTAGTSENVDTMEIDNLRLELSLLQLKLKEMELIREELGHVQKEKMILEQTVIELKKKAEEDMGPRVSPRGDGSASASASALETRRASPSPRETSENGRRISSPKDSPADRPRRLSKDVELSRNVEPGRNVEPSKPKKVEPVIGKRGGPKVLREGRNSPSPEPSRMKKKSPRDSMSEFKQSVEDSLPMDDSKETEKKASP